MHAEMHKSFDVCTCCKAMQSASTSHAAMTVTVNCRAPRARRCLIRGRECLQQGACSAQLQCKRASACQGTHRHLCPLWPPRSHTLAQHILLPRTPLVEGTTGSERRADWRSSAALLRTPEAYSWWLPGLALSHCMSFLAVMQSIVCSSEDSDS
jgi:hypothetical protein